MRLLVATVCLALWCGLVYAEDSVASIEITKNDEPKSAEEITKNDEPKSVEEITKKDEPKAPEEITTNDEPKAEIKTELVPTQGDEPEVGEDAELAENDPRRHPYHPRHMTRSIMIKCVRLKISHKCCKNPVCRRRRLQAHPRHMTRSIMIKCVRLKISRKCCGNPVCRRRRLQAKAKRKRGDEPEVGEDAELAENDPRRHPYHPRHMTRSIMIKCVRLKISHKCCKNPVCRRRRLQAHPRHMTRSIMIKCVRLKISRKCCKNSVCRRRRLQAKAKRKRGDEPQVEEDTELAKNDPRRHQQYRPHPAGLPRGHHGGRGQRGDEPEVEKDAKLAEKCIKHGKHWKK